MRATWTALMIVSLGLAPVAAQTRAPSATVLSEGNPDLAKVSSDLLSLRWVARQPAAVRNAFGRSGPLSVRQVPIVDGQVAIEIRLRSLDRALLETIRTLGVEVHHASFRWARVDGSVALDLLDEIAALEEVSTIHPALAPRTRFGAVADQADVTLNSDDARAQFGVDGSGVTIGVLSDSWRDLSSGTVSGTSCARSVTGTASQLSADAPAAVGVLSDGPGSNSDEGRAMSELVYDLAPGAPQIFRSAFVSMSDFALGITELKNCGADVIVDDVFYTSEPMFQDGIIAQAAQQAVDTGVPYFSAAGNDATFGVDDIFVDSNGTDDKTDPPTGNDFHDFDPGPGGDTFARVIVPGDSCEIQAVLQWNEPFSGGLGPGAASDLDLYACSAENVATCTFSSKTRQGCGAGPPPAGDPLEMLTVINTGPSALPIYFAVEHHCGNQTNLRFRIVTLTSCSHSSYDFEDGGPGETAIFVDEQVYGHPVAAGAAAVAASFFGEIDSGGTVVLPVGQVDVEPFSSKGGSVPIYFDGAGTLLPSAPELRFKPEITAPDGTNTTFFGADTSFDPDTDPNFFGTSAAAPHAAAVAALMMQGTTLSPSGVVQVLEASARDMETPGVDDLSGNGVIDALESVGSVQSGTLAACECGLATQKCVDDLELTGAPNTNTVGMQPFRACGSLIVGSGTFDHVKGVAQTIVFRSGFKSAGPSSWGK